MIHVLIIFHGKVEGLKGIKESYHYALSHDMAQGALVFRGTSACTKRSFDG